MKIERKNRVNRVKVLQLEKYYTLMDKDYWM